MQQNTSYRKLLITLIFCFIAAISFKTKAQTVVVFGDSTKVSQLLLNECGESDTFTTYIRVAVGSLAGTVNYTDTFPSNFIFTGVVSDPVITGVAGTGTNIASLILSTSLLNGSSTGYKIKLLIRAKCGANGLLTSKHGMLLTATAFYSYKAGLDFVSGIKAPTLILEARNTVDNANAVLGQTYLRNWRIRNTGTNSRIDTIWFSTVYQQGTQYTDLIVDGVPVAPTRISGDSIFYRIIKTFRNQSIFPGDTVFVQEAYKVNSCTNPSGSSTVSTYWGCLNAPICNVASRFPSTQIPLTVPNIKASLVETKYGCYGSYDTVTLMYFNTGGNATDVRMRFDGNYPIPAYQNDPDISASISYFDTASIQVKVKYNGTYVHQSPDSTVRFDNSRSFWPETNPAGIVYLNKKLFKSGDTVFVKFRRFRGKYDNTYCSNTEIYLNYHVYFKNNCGNAFYDVPMTNIQGEAHRYYGKTNYNAPAYLIFNDTGSFEFTTLRGSHFNHFQSANSLFMLKVEVPPGLIWDGDTSVLKLTRVGDPTMNKRVDSWSWNPTTRILEAYWKIPNDNTYAVTAKPNFYLNCGVPGAGGTQSIYAQWFRIPQVKNCLWQLLPYSCRDGNPLTMICPSPCPRGGVVPYLSEFRRTTFGLPDNDQNGIPDGSGSIDMTKVEWNKLAPRDTFTLTYKGWIARGSQSPTSFTNGYGRVWIPNYGSQVSPVSAKITIKDLSAGSTFTVNNLPTTTLDTGVRRTLRYDFSNTVTGFPTGYIFDHGDSFTFTATYIYNPTVAENANPDDAVTASISLYVSPYANPVVDSAKYRCIDLPGTYRVVNVYKGYNGGFVARPVGCQQIAVYSDYFQSVGDCCSNYAGSTHFPYEYRLFTTLDTVRIRIPAGYVLDSTRITYVYTAGAGKGGSRVFSLPVHSVSGEWYTFLLTPFYNFAGGTQVPSTTGSYWQMYNYIKPTCSLPVGNVQTQFTADRWLGKNTWSGISVRGVANNHNRGTYEYMEAAQLDLSNLGASNVLAINKVATWDIKLQNSAVTAIANNTWVAFKSNTGGIVVDSIRNIATNALMPSTGGVFKLGDIAGGGTVNTYKLYAHYNACIYDSLSVYSGWTCQAYPTSLAAAVGSCRNDSIKVYIQPLSPLVQTDLVIQPPDPISLCDTLNWLVSVSNRQVASAYNVTLDVIFPNGGVGNSIIPSYGYKYPYNQPTFTSISPVAIGGGVFRFYLSDSIASLGLNGLRPIDESPNNQIYLNVRALTNCDFTSGSAVRFIVNSKKACNVALTPDAEFDPVNISGAPAPKLLLGGSVEAPITTCDKDFTVRISVRNYELSPTNLNDRLYVTLPSGAEFVTGSTVYTRNAFATAAPIVTTVGGLQRLEYISHQVPSNDSSVFTIKIRSNSNTACGSTSVIVVSSRSKYIAVCGLGTCTSEVLNWEDTKNMPVYKPDLRFITGTMRMIKDTSLGNIFMSDTIQAKNLTFTNTGNDTANVVYLQFFHDLNGNKTKDLAESVWSRDTIYNVLPGETRLLNWTKIFGHNTVPDSLRLFINTACNCNQSAFVASPTNEFIPLSISLGYFTVRKVNQNGLLEWLTYQENNSSHFEIERKLPGSSAFEKIATLPAAGFSIDNRYYRYFDPLVNLKQGEIYYRIKMIDANGNGDYSPVRSLLNYTGDLYHVNIVPNPSNGTFSVWLDAIDGDEYQIEVFNVQGEKISNLEKQGSIDGNSKVVSYDKSALSSGMYIVKVKVGEQSYAIKLLIQ